MVARLYPSTRHGRLFVGYDRMEFLDNNPITTGGTSASFGKYPHTIRRLGDLVLDLEPPDAVPITRLDLQPRALFPGGPAA